ncbi:unnamed protein product [Linum trigynum]|uniref:TIR domain-containing protein n=1 Tax=Linum trigynum TaxID=586398 RepID=A0AAV2DN82_9ROSI
MDYAKGAVTSIVVIFIPLLILLYKLWLGRRNSDASNRVDNASTQPDSIANASESADSENTLLPLPSGEYEVFLSFRGPDTRYQITDILYRFLVNLKIRTFKDDDELRKGEGIWPSLVKAIEQSKIYVPIFSENYACSKWCLRELAAMVERQERDEGCIILPIFYMVDPRDVRHQSGPYEEAFQKHNMNFEEKTTEVWKAAMNKVGALKGWHIQSNNEQGAITDLVTGVIWSHLSKNNYLLETDELVGIDDHIKEVEERMSLDSGGMIIVGIHGLGGIGKTTLAKAVYNKTSALFDRCCFMENVRETLQQNDGCLILQKNLISSILRTKFDCDIANASEGVKIVRDRVYRFKVLIVLDDVDEKLEFRSILGDTEDLVPGSRFIVTSRNIKVLSTLTEQDRLYGVRKMSPPHALQLFCKHSFRKDSPPPLYETLSEDIVSVAGGLPLTLKLVGSLLFKEDEGIWKEKLRQLREVPEEEVVERLKISYDTLNNEAKQIFLDIACFFIETEKEIASYMWSDCGLFPIVNINILIQRCMIEMDDHDKFQMHDQLRDMAREIIRQEDIKYPWKRSRIWSAEMAMDMLRDKKGTDRVEAIRVNLSFNDDDDNEDNDVVEEELEKDCFMNLSELRYLEVRAAKLACDISNHLPNLRWLRLELMDGYGLDNIGMKNLVILQLLQPVDESWEGWSHIKVSNKLKVLEFLGDSLTKLPQFPQSGRLEVLSVSQFSGESGYLDIGNLRNLKVLRLEGCDISEIRGGTIGMMKGLRELDFSEFCCEKNLRQVLRDIGELRSLEILMVSCETNLLLGIKLPTSLKVLETSSPVANLPELSELENLAVRDCDSGLEIPTADSSMWWKISKLKSLSLSNSKMTTSITTSPTPLLLLPSSLTSLVIYSCPKLVWLPSLENLENLTQFKISLCPSLKQIPSLDSLLSLTSLSLSGCKALERLPSLAYLSKLLELDIDFCPRLAEIQGLGGLRSLQKLSIDDAESLTRLLGFRTLLSFNKLTTLIIGISPLLSSVSFKDPEYDDDGDGQLAAILNSLRYLLISGTTPVLQSFCQILHLSKFPMTKQLKITGTGGKDNVDTELVLDWIESMEELNELTLLDLASIRRLPPLSKLRKLYRLTVTDAPNLQEIGPLGGLSSLEHLDFSGCTSLQRLPEDLSSLEQLQSVNIRGCTSLSDFSALKNLQQNVTIWWPVSNALPSDDADLMSDSDLDSNYDISDSGSVTVSRSIRIYNLDSGSDADSYSSES